MKMLLNIGCFIIGFIFSYIICGVVTRDHMRDIVKEIKAAVLAGPLKLHNRLEWIVKTIELNFYL